MDADQRSEAAPDVQLRLLRAAQARGSCGRVMLRARDESFLLRETCRTVVAAGYHACAFHQANNGAANFELVASAGAEVAASLPRRDPDGDERLTPASDHLVERITNPSLGEPVNTTVARFLIRPAGAGHLVLNVYAREESAHQTEELAELRELARDLLAGIEGVARRARAVSGTKETMLGARVSGVAPGKVESALRDQLDMTRSITDSAQDGIVMVDFGGKIIYWNRAATTIFGWQADEVMGAVAHKFLIPERLKKNLFEGLPIFSSSGKGSEVGMLTELVGQRKDGSEFPMELSLARVSFRGRVGAVGIVRDVTERQKVLEDLRQAKTEAEAAAEAKSLFLANMSHEIRTPLNAVIGMTGLLLDTELDSQQRDFARIVHRSGESLLAVINDILDFSKMDADALEFEVIPFSVRTCVEEVGDILAQRAASKGIELVMLIDHNVPRRVAGDPGRLRQVLTNLINNSIKFTETGEVVVRIGLTASRENEHRLSFSVRDTGIGIPEDRLRDLFKPFTQVDASTTRRYGGTGLGLSIVKRLVDRMGGDVEVKSEVGRGTEFRFEAVYSSAPDEEERARPIRRGDLGRKKVLIVDDNQTNRRLLEELLGRWGCSTASVASGREALDLLTAVDRRTTFDLAILDFSMPSMDGATLAKTIRVNPELENLPLILLTSMPMFGDGERMKEIGFDAYLTKPVKQSYLYDAIVSVTTDDPRASDDERAFVTQHTLNEARRSRLRILVTEDNIVNQKVLSRMLESLGYRCDLADNGKEAIEALGRRAYDLVFMDCQMPVMDGFEATRQIRALDEPLCQIPIVATTAEALKGDRERCIEAGMDDYISKPIDRNELAKVLQKIGGVEAPVPVDESEDEGSTPSPIEIERLQAISRGDRSFEQRILTLYLGESVKRQKAIEAAVDEGDFETLREDAHAVKGSAGNIGAALVSELAGKLQRAAEEQDAGACRELSSRLIRENDTVNGWLETYISDDADPGAGGADE